MAETLLKSVRIRERWGDINLYDENGSPKYKWVGRGFDIKISVFKSGNKRRIVRAFDVGGSERGSGDPQEGDRYSSKTLKWLNPIEYKEGDALDWTFGEYGDNAFIYQYITTQAAILKREKYYDGTAFKPSPYTNSEQPDIILADWISLRTSNSNNVVKLNSPDYFGQSLNESDKIYRKKFGYNPPYYEIIQDPFINPLDELGKNKLLFRNFGLDRYYLNNGSEILIEWKKDGTTITGTDYSDNWQRELDIYDIEKSEYSNIEITKSATIYGPPTNNSGYNDAERFCLSSEITEVYDGYGFDDENKVRNDVGFIMLKEIDGVKYESKVWNAKRSANVSRKLYGGGIYDEEILNEIIEKWQQSYGNTKLKLNDNALTPTTPTLEFKLPVLLNSQIDPGGTPSQIGGTPSQIDPVGGTPSTTGLSQSILLNVVFPSEFEVKVREDVPKFKIWVGDPQPEEQVDGFITEDFEQTDEEGNVVELSNEYSENEYSGAEENYKVTNLNSVDDAPDEKGTGQSAIEIEESKEIVDVGKSLIGPGPPAGSKLLKKSSYKGKEYYYIVGSDGLAGHRLKLILSDLQKHLNANGYKDTKIGNNGIIRDLVASTYPSSSARAVASLHGAGLAIDVTFAIPGKKWSGIGDNGNLSSDANLTKVIWSFVKSQGDITWGAQWGDSKPADGVVKGRGIIEYHHFEIKSSKIAEYWKPFEKDLKAMGFDYTKLNSIGDKGEIFKLNKYLLNSVGIT
jgi:hypothetical protein